MVVFEWLAMLVAVTLQISLKDLRNNKDIIITKPDKGSGIVLINKEDYVKKMEEHLKDSTRFSKCTKGKDRTSQVEKSITKLLSSLKQRNIIDQTTWENLRPTGSIIPRLYGLPKIHKPGTPLRPVLDMVNSPYHAVAKWLCKKIEQIRKLLTKHCLKDSFEFIETVKDLNLTDKTMFSLDVSSLFTNVPLKETIEFLCEFIEHNAIDIGLPPQDLKVLLYRCTQNVQFKFNNHLYSQIDGVAMGSPLGPLLADVFMAKLENEQLQTSIKKFCVYKRYVDDIWCLLDRSHDPITILNEFNATHTNINFTIETESDGQLAFLDVCLKRRPDGTVQRTVFRKATWTDQYMHFKSFVPMKHKANLVT